jgi:Retinal pigment epithelial membrane protein
MTTTDLQPRHASIAPDPKPHFPKALMSASREEFYGQDDEHHALPLTIKIKTARGYEPGKLPDDLQGHVFIIGPVGSVSSPSAPRSANDPPQPSDRYTILPTQDGWTPLFNGDGMIYRLDFHKTPIAPALLNPSDRIQPGKEPVMHSYIAAPGSAWLATRLSKPPDFFADALSHDQFPALQFQPLGLVRFSPRLGFAKQINTSFLPVTFPWENRTRLLAMNDASRPYEIDPVTLRLIAPVGLNRDWHETKTSAITTPPVLPDIDTSGHPCFDPTTGEVITVNLVRSLKTILGSARLFQGDPIPATPGWKRVWRSLLKLLREAVWLPLEVVEWFAEKLGILASDALYVVRWLGTEELQNWKVLLPNGQPVKIRQLAHMIGLSARYVVIADTAIKLVPEDILPNTVIARLQHWLDHLEHNLDEIGAAQLADLMQAKYQAILRWIRKELSQPQAPNTVFYLVPRQALNDTRSGDTIIAQPITVAGELYHFLTDYDETAEGKVTLHAAMAYASDSSEFIHGNDRAFDDATMGDRLRSLAGSFASGMDVNNLALIELDPDRGTAQKHQLSLEKAQQHMFFTGLYACQDRAPTYKFEDIYWFGGGVWEEIASQFIYDMYQDYPIRNLPLPQVLEAIQHQLPINLCRLHIDRRALDPAHFSNPDSQPPDLLSIADFYTFPQTYFANSPQFVPSSDPTKAGYIICNVIHSDQFFSDSSHRPEADWSANSELWIFAADDLQSGPRYKLSHPKLNFSLTLHTTWLPEITSAPPTHYNIRADYEWLVERATKNSPEKTRTQIHELFAQIYRSFETE